MNPVEFKDLPGLVGQEVGVSDWLEITQERVNQFADATGDHQWIHVDRERAQRESPFGGTVAHGFLTVALAPALLPELVQVANCSRIINFGIEKLRLREPVRSGAKLRLGATIAGVRSVPGGGMWVSLAVRFEVEGAKRPVCAGELIFVYFP